MPEGKKGRYEIAPGPDVDLEQEDVRDIKGNPITAAYVEQAVARGHEHFEKVGRPGRPSMSEPGTKSPAMSVRLPAPLKQAVEERARREGRRPADIIRSALQLYLGTGAPRRRRAATKRAVVPRPRSNG